MLEILSLLKLDWSSDTISIDKATSKKIRALMRSISFFFIILEFIFIDIPFGFAYNTVVEAELMDLFGELKM